VKRARSIAVVALACAVLGACASDRKAAEAPKTERKQEKLTPEQQALMDAYDAGSAEWESAREKALADPELRRFLVDHLVLRMVQAYDQIARPGAEDASAQFDRAQGELVRIGTPAAGVLTALLAVSDGVVATLSARTLERIGRPAIDAVLPLTRSKAVRTRQRATELLRALPHAASDEPAVQAELVRLLHDDPDWVVRAHAATAIGARGARDRTTEPARKALAAAITAEKDPAVAEAAAAGLAALGDPLAVPALLEVLAPAVQRGDLRMVRACQGALIAVTGERAEHDLEGWTNWWYAKRDQLARPKN
jgi:HEAT repeat protein